MVVGRLLILRPSWRDGDVGGLFVMGWRHVVDGGKVATIYLNGGDSEYPSGIM